MIVDLDIGLSITTVSAATAQAPGSATATVLLLVILLVALAVVVGALQAGVSTLLSLIRELVALLMAQVGRLLLIGLCLLCLVVVLIAPPK